MLVGRETITLKMDWILVSLSRLDYIAFQNLSNVRFKQFFIITVIGRIQYSIFRVQLSTDHRNTNIETTLIVTVSSTFILQKSTRFNHYLD